MTFETTVTIDDRRARAKLRRLDRSVADQQRKAVIQLAYMGRDKARSIAPHQTGWLIQNIVAFTAQGTEARVMARNPTAGDGHKRKIANFNLVRWMHTSPRAQGHIKTGDRFFMYTTRAYLQREKRTGKITGGFKRIYV